MIKNDISDQINMFDVTIEYLIANLGTLIAKFERVPVVHWKQYIPELHNPNCNQIYEGFYFYITDQI